MNYCIYNKFNASAVLSTSLFSQFIFSILFCIIQRLPSFCDWTIHLFYICFKKLYFFVCNFYKKKSEKYTQKKNDFPNIPIIFIDDSTDSSPISYRSVARRKTDLMPTIPSPRDANFGSRSSLYCSTPRTQGKAKNKKNHLQPLSSTQKIIIKCI